jgi:hypothetical protein
MLDYLALFTVCATRKHWPLATSSAKFLSASDPLAVAPAPYVAGGAPGLTGR